MIHFARTHGNAAFLMSILFWLMLGLPLRAESSELSLAGISLEWAIPICYGMMFGNGAIGPMRTAVCSIEHTPGGRRRVLAGGLFMTATPLLVLVAVWWTRGMPLEAILVALAVYGAFFVAWSASLYAFHGLNREVALAQGVSLKSRLTSSTGSPPVRFALLITACLIVSVALTLADASAALLSLGVYHTPLFIFFLAPPLRQPQDWRGREQMRSEILRSAIWAAIGNTLVCGIDIILMNWSEYIGVSAFDASSLVWLAGTGLLTFALALLFNVARPWVSPVTWIAGILSLILWFHFEMSWVTITPGLRVRAPYWLAPGLTLLTLFAALYLFHHFARRGSDVLGRYAGADS